MVATAISVNVEHTYITRVGTRVFGSLLFWFLVSCLRFFLCLHNFFCVRLTWVYVVHLNYTILFNTTVFT